MRTAFFWFKFSLTLSSESFVCSAAFKKAEIESKPTRTARMRDFTFGPLFACDAVSN